MDETCGVPPNHSTAQLITTPSESDIYKIIGQWLLQFLPSGFEVLQGQLNRVPSPLTSYVTMVIILRSRLATNGSDYTATERSITQPTILTMQISAFGQGASDAIHLISTLWRDNYATEFIGGLTDRISPLYASDPRQVTYVNEQSNYEDMWTIDLKMQVNFTVTIPNGSADKVTLTVIEADQPHS
ncbi:phage neck terminator protein [Swingsia samuiensis]|uniref:Phage neck terminator protein gp12-like domain-containing protein n=1 Tax=Swingsia samuiensis TaxID=1293412 RepID=A0A4Y6UKT9_9PROT|nr:hypothetical protein [Swingsia samuiensis]QDH17410.1 hypothetical protein E3D00_07405 [Swingsia samuiensis]